MSVKENVSNQNQYFDAHKADKELEDKWSKTKLDHLKQFIEKNWSYILL